jgi:hypothetical protein
MALFRTTRTSAPTAETQDFPPRQRPSHESVAYEINGWDEDFNSRPRVLVTALGREDIPKEEMIRSTCGFVLSDGQFPVVAATGLNMEFIVSAAMPVETLPTRADLRCLEAHEYRIYVERRWEILLAKWRITETIDLGLEFEDFLNREAAG